MVINSKNKSTPTRVVFNFSQTYCGFSLNSSIDLGPDCMTSLQGVLLRFRENIHGAQGDMKKMFYSVRVVRAEEMCQLFVWRWKGESETRTYAMARLPTGNKRSSNILITAVRETSNLEDFKDRFPDAFKALNQDSYVDNIFTWDETAKAL